MRQAAWSGDRVALLKRLWAKGETAAAIGAHLGGLSRAAVLGKIFRLRLEGADNAAAGRKKKTAPASNAAKKQSPAWRRRGARRTMLQQQQANANRRGRTLLELTSDCCRWPHGRPGTARFFFCGAPGADLGRGVPYCPRHMARAYLADPPKVVRPNRGPAGAAA